MVLWGVLAAHGQLPRVRFANAQMRSSPPVLSLATHSYGPINSLAAASSNGDSLPVSDYLPLPQPELPLGEPIPFYLSYNGSQLTAPINITLAADQSYTIVAAGPSEFINQTVPMTLFSVYELPPNPALFANLAFLKVINAVRKHRFLRVYTGEKLIIFL